MSGWSKFENEYLRCVAQNWDEEEVWVMEEFGLKHLNGEMPTWFYKVWNSVSSNWHATFDPIFHIEFSIPMNSLNMTLHFHPPYCQ